MKLSPKFRPLLKKSRYKSLRGGRGGMKSWAVAALLVEIARRGRYRFLCARELQNSIGDSVITLLSDTIDRFGYTAEFEVQRNRLICLHTGTEFLFYGIKNNPTKIKSIEGIDICWVEEAENVSKDSWDILIPTIRKEGSEIWLSWNPKNILDATYQYFVANPPKDLIEIVVNYTDNPYLPDVLLKDAEECKERDYDLYRHIWLGEPVADSELSIIKPMWIDAAVNAHVKLGFDAAGQRIIGFDVADEGDDANAIVLRHGSVVLDLDEWRNQDVIASAEKVHAYSNDVCADRIIYDSIGVGAGVKAQFKRLHGKVQTTGFNAGGSVYKPDAKFTDGKKNKDMFANIKAQTWWAVRERFYKTWRALEFGDVYPVDELISLSGSLKDLDYLKAELSRPRVAYDKNGRVMVESKADMKKRGIPSPNKADALIMAFATINLGLKINPSIVRKTR
ncbi:PBSX family phage terminase large subunit [Wielerella bovis]|uniref:PBSX family phage terminase large subunit n=1 Tax=Wielerella bovis TaxID=2917790 RepID=UPI002018F279|nr:PBSX family phage terminase large subunit [Wielerella bovis]ULJ60786.1 PBSX family phage terminase large subunit [Wielerella bovis]